MCIIPKLLFLFVLVTLLMGCPDPKTGKVDPYLTAENSISFAKSSLVLADTMFQQVTTYAGITGDKLASAKATYKKVRTAVEKALDAAMVALNIAKENKDGVNVGKLLASTDKAWTALRDFISSLIPAGEVSGAQSLAGTPLVKPDINELPVTLIKN